MDRRSRTILRPVSDIRQLPFVVGAVQTLWGFIPAMGIKGSLFSKQLDFLGIYESWGFLMILTGSYLTLSSVLAKRINLDLGLFLSATVWSAMGIVFLDAWLRYPYAMSWTTPVTLAIPLFALSCWFALCREMFLRPVQIPDRRGYRNVNALRSSNNSNN